MKQRMIPIVAFSIFLLMLTFQQCGVDFRPKLNELSRMGFEDPHDKGPLGEGNVPTGGEQYQLPSYTPRIGDRRYISSKLQNIFIDATNTNNAANTAVQGLITANIMKKSSFFGGSCTYNDSLSCRGEGVVATDLAAVLPSSSPTRQGLRINTCRTIAGIDGAIVSALGNAGLAPADILTEDRVKQLYDMFFVGNEPSPEELISFRDIFELESKMNTFERWRLLILTFCESPAWEVL